MKFLTITILRLFVRPFFIFTSLGECSKQQSWLGPTVFFNNDAPQGRFAHGLAHLNGKLYVFSGVTMAGKTLNDFSVFNPETRLWASLSDSDGMPSGRSSFGFVSAGARLYVFGGFDAQQENLLADFHSYDPSTQVWEDLTAIAGPLPREGFAFTSLQDDIYLFGGALPDGSCDNNLFRFDPLKRLWTNLSDHIIGAPSPRAYAQLVSSAGALYLLGGISCDFLYDQILPRLDLGTMTWTNIFPSSTGDPPFGSIYPSRSALNGIIYAFSMDSEGETTYLYQLDLSTLAWSIVHHDPFFDKAMDLAMVSTDDTLYTFGGYEFSATAIDNLRWMDFSIPAWIGLKGPLQGSIPIGRWFPGFVGEGGNVYLHGGRYRDDADGGLIGDLKQLDLKRLTWTDLTSAAVGPAPLGRCCHGFAAAHANLYVFGGLVRDEMTIFRSGVQNDFYRFDPLALIWTNLSVNVIGEPPSPRSYFGFTSINGSLYVFGGMLNTGNLSQELHQFDTQIMTWTELLGDGPIPCARYQMGFASAGGKLYMYGGTTSRAFEDYFGDLYRFDPITMVWTDLTGVSSGSGPGVRMGPVMTQLLDNIYLFGGSGSNANFFKLHTSTLEWEYLDDQATPSSVAGGVTAHGFAGVEGSLFVFGGSYRGFTAELRTIIAPAEMKWTEGSGGDFFIDFFDWDTLVLAPESVLELSWHMDLCSGFFPCRLSIRGEGGRIQRSPHGYVSCLSSSGCIDVILDNVNFVCQGGMSDFPLLTSAGTVIDAVNSTFANCSSSSRGSVLYAYDSAEIKIYFSTFWGAKSDSGGAITIVSGSLDASESRFENCVSTNGGGALFASTYHCDGMLSPTTTSVMVRSCLFVNCSSGGTGGAIKASGSTVTVDVRNSDFIGCSSADAGGAISANTSSKLNVFDSVFQRNVASGRGGGALYSDDANIVLEALTCLENSAAAGGGGVLLWTGTVLPEFRFWCKAGSELASKAECTPEVCEPSCRLCQPGTFKSAEGSENCSLCERGKYSTAWGSATPATCIPCGAGTFSPTAGASTVSECTLCTAGSFSDAPAVSVCSLCGVGTVSTAEGAVSRSTCVECTAGKYLSASGASSFDGCTECEAGSYSHPGASACTLCPAGSFSVSLGSSSVFQCHRCFAGKYSSVAGSVSCDDCSDGGIDEESNSTLCDNDAESCDSIGPGICKFTCDFGSLNISMQEEDSPRRRLIIAPFAALFVNLTIIATSCCSILDVGECSSAGCNDYRKIASLSSSSRAATSLVGTGVIILDIQISNSSNDTGWSVVWSTEKLGATMCTSCSENITLCGNVSDISSDDNVSDASSEDAERSKILTTQNLLNKALIASSAGQNHVQWLSHAWIQERRMRRSALLMQERRMGATTSKFFARHEKYSNDVNDKSTEFAEMTHRKGSALLNNPNCASSYYMRPKLLRRNSVVSRHFCGAGNVALYGPCLATRYKSLEISGWPTSENPGHCGLPIPLVLVKKDWYDQAVMSDSSTVLQAMSTSSFVSIAGSSVSLLDKGRTVFNCVLKPAISQLVPQVGIAKFIAQPFIYFKGIDSETLLTLQTLPVPVMLSNDTHICPEGYVLSLENSKGDAARAGSCSFCVAGTYSVNALTGTTPQIPSCLNCPVNAVCRGGSSVEFTLGYWKIVGGVYRLLGCPPGYQLVNSINGVFSHDSQQCLPCLSNQYVLDSSNSNFSCQNCPLGASCDGKTLKAKVEGSVWEANNITGLYRLISCPPGYEKKVDSQESQLCQLCPVSYFCIGGPAGSTACPANTFAPLGSNSSIDCMPVVYVAVSVSLPMSKADFIAKQQSFQESLAAASGVSVSRVVIESVSETRRSAAFVEQKPWENIKIVINIDADSMHAFETKRSGLPLLRVNSKVASEDSNSASSLSTKLDTAALNAQLTARGLPQGSIESVSVLNVKGEDTKGVPVSLVAGVASGAFVALVIFLISGYTLARKLHVQNANRTFKAAIRMVRSGDKATNTHLPFALRKFYTAQQILGKGAFGVVVQAKTKQGGQAVAIKIVLPDKDAFADREIRQLRREAVVLEMFTRTKTDTAVHLAGSEAVQIQPEICWFVMDLLNGENMQQIILDQGPIGDLECIQAARHVLASLKVMHADGLVHRDIKPANIVRCKHAVSGDNSPETEFVKTFKLVDFGTALGVDEAIAKESMLTLTGNRNIGAGTPPYMSPEMFKSPETAMYSTDIWSLGVTLFEMVTGRLPFLAESDMLWSVTVAGDMSQRAPSVLDILSEDKRSRFDNGLAKVIAKALEKEITRRFQSVDEMHEALYSCLINRGEATYSVFISYRVGSDMPFARLLFDELNHSVTPGGHRVTVYWDAHRLVKGEDWEEGFATGLLNSLCFFPVMSYGATSPLACLPMNQREELLAIGWDDKPLGRRRLEGSSVDSEDNVLKEYKIAEALLKRGSSSDLERKAGIMQIAYPLLLGRHHPNGHPDYPRMGSFFAVQGGGGRYPKSPSPATTQAVIRFLRERACLDDETLTFVENQTVEATVTGFTSLQGCQMWTIPSDQQSVPLTREQRGLIGTGYAGPPVDLGVQLTSEQRKDLCTLGLDEEQLQMLKASIRHKRNDFFEIIDRAVALQKGLVDPHGNQVLRATDSLSRTAQTAVWRGIAETGGPGPAWATADIVESRPGLR